MTDTTVVTDKPLCVDLDGTLVATDTLWEGVLRLVLRDPLMVFAVFRWMLAGKAALKQAVAEHSERDPSAWPVRLDLLELLQREKRAGRRLVLATGAPAKVAQGIADRLGIFD